MTTALCYNIVDKLFYVEYSHKSRQTDVRRCCKTNMGKILSFVNQKGGVGKTTSAVNVAASLGVLGKKVLLVDMDPQGNATSGLGIMKRSISFGMLELLLGKTTPDKAIINTKFNNLSIIPSTLSLASAEFELGDMEDGEYCLKNALEGIKNDYDYVIVDCPPSLGLLTVNILSASDGVIIPMQCEFYSLEGLSQLMLTVKRIRAHYNSELLVSGILVTMHNPRLLISMQVMDQLEDHYHDILFKTQISRNVKISESPGFGKPVYYHDKKSKGAKEYLEVAKELMARI